jgi:hypothetical protein
MLVVVILVRYEMRRERLSPGIALKSLRMNMSRVLR